MKGSGRIVLRFMSAVVLLTILLTSSKTTVCAEPVTAAMGPLMTKTVLFVHGGGHGAWCWYKVATMLQEAGFNIHLVDLTSHGRDQTSADTIKTLSHYAKPLTNHLSNMTGKVVLVAHSLGGAAASYAMETYPEKVSKVVYIAAVMPLNGQRPIDPILPYFNSLDMGIFTFNYREGRLMQPTSFSVNLTAARSFFYPRAPSMDITLALTMLDDTPYYPLMDVIKLTTTNYGSIDRYYILCGADKVIPYEYQQKMIRDTPVKQQFILKSSDHAPFFSETSYLFTLLKTIAYLM